MDFSSECYSKDIVKISKEKKENFIYLLVSRFEKSAFEKDAFDVLKCFTDTFPYSFPLLCNPTQSKNALPCSNSPLLFPSLEDFMRQSACCQNSDSQSSVDDYAF